MSYEEFWQKDYRLVESYVKRHEMLIERETASNWELVTYIRGAMLEIVTNMYNKKGDKPFEFPDKPSPRTKTGQLHEKRNKSITQEIRAYYEAKIKERKEKLTDKK